MATPEPIATPPRTVPTGLGAGLSTGEEVRRFLDATKDRWILGQEGYFGRLALQEALAATVEGNYGIGGVAIRVRGNEVAIFRGRNAMVTGSDELRQLFGTDNANVITQLIGHGEPSALIKAIHPKAEPFEVHHKQSNGLLAQLPEGITVVTTLEPCPMCTCICTNQRDTVKVVSNCLDEFGSYTVNDRGSKQPKVWTAIQEARGLQFTTLEGLPGFDELAALSSRIFLDTREEIDRRLSTRG